MDRQSPPLLDVLPDLPDLIRIKRKKVYKEVAIKSYADKVEQIFASLNEQLESTSVINDELEKQISQLKAKNDELLQQDEVRTSRIEELEKQLSQSIEKPKEKEDDHDTYDSSSDSFISELKRENAELHETLQFLRNENDVLKKGGELTDDAISRIFQVLSNLYNNILNNKCSKETLTENIEFLKALMNPLGVDIYYFNRGDLYSATNDSHKAEPNQYNFVKTTDKKQDSTVYCCDQIGYRIEKLGIGRTGKVTLYTYQPEDDLDNSITDKE